MMNLAGRKRFALTAIAVLPLVVVALQGQAADAPTDADCRLSWSWSKASESCGEDNSTYYIVMAASVDTNKYHVVASNGECYVEVDCLTSNASVVANEYSGSQDQVESLSNCEGTLKEGNC